MHLSSACKIMPWLWHFHTYRSLYLACIFYPRSPPPSFLPISLSPPHLSSLPLYLLPHLSSLPLSDPLLFSSNHPHSALMSHQKELNLYFEYERKRVIFCLSFPCPFLPSHFSPVTVPNTHTHTSSHGEILAIVFVLFWNPQVNISEVKKGRQTPVVPH